MGPISFSKNRLGIISLNTFYILQYAAYYLLFVDYTYHESLYFRSYLVVSPELFRGGILENISVKIFDYQGHICHIYLLTHLIKYI